MKARYLFSLLSNMLRAGLSFYTGILLARYLGPVDYGRYAFLLASFISIRQFLDMGSSQAFFTFMSKKEQTKSFFFKYIKWILFQFTITSILILIIFPSSFINYIWHGEARWLIYFTFVSTFIQNSLWTSIQQALESQRKTYIAQGVTLILVFLNIIYIYILSRYNLISIQRIFYFFIIEYLIATIVVINFLNFNNSKNDENIFLLYYNYCKPLIFYTLICFFYSFFDNWILQKYGGNVKQAFFSISSQFASVSLLATSSILNIFYKEITESYNLGNHKESFIIYNKISKFLFFIAAFLACFMLPWSNFILNFLYGNKYLGSYFTLMIMLIYPIHQSLGQISTLVFLATDQVAFQVKIGLIFMISSIVITFLSFYFLNIYFKNNNLSSELIAIKLVVLQIIQVNFTSFYIYKFFNQKFEWVYQISVFAILSIFSFLLFYLSNHFLINNLILIIVSFLIYSLATLFIILNKPNLFGFYNMNFKDYYKKSFN